MPYFAHVSLSQCLILQMYRFRNALFLIQTRIDEHLMRRLVFPYFSLLFLPFPLL